MRTRALLLSLTRLFAVLLVIVGLSLIVSGCGGGGGHGGGFTPATNSNLTIASITPNRGITAGGTNVVLAGANFDSNTVVLIGGQLVSGLVVRNNGTELDGIAPASVGNAQGSVNVTVKKGNEQVEISGGYTYSNETLPPIVSFISPSSGPANGDTLVTITGQNFAQGSTTVLIGGKALSGVSVDSTGLRLTGRTTANVAGTYDVVVTTPVAPLAKLSSAFTYEASSNGSSGGSGGGSTPPPPPPPATVALVCSYTVSTAAPANKATFWFSRPTPDTLKVLQVVGVAPGAPIDLTKSYATLEPSGTVLGNFSGNPDTQNSTTAIPQVAGTTTLRLHILMELPDHTQVWATNFDVDLTVLGNGGGKVMKP